MTILLCNTAPICKHFRRAAQAQYSLHSCFSQHCYLRGDRDRACDLRREVPRGRSGPRRLSLLYRYASCSGWFPWQKMHDVGFSGQQCLVKTNIGWFIVPAGGLRIMAACIRHPVTEHVLIFLFSLHMISHMYITMRSVAALGSNLKILRP